MCFMLRPGELSPDGAESAGEQRLPVTSTKNVFAMSSAMLNDRWRPKPPPEWVTWLSQTCPDLFPGYGRRLASALELPFEPAMAKTRANEPQKGQQSRFHQCRNLDGVFAINGPVPKGPVLPVDGAIDSRWTLTVTAALFLQSGYGPVWPLALTTSSMGA